MRERQHLDDAIGAVKAAERDLEDNLGLIELGEAESDRDVVAEAEGAVARLHKEMLRRQVETIRGAVALIRRHL